MKFNWLVNGSLFIAGMCFNIIVFAIGVYFVLTYSMQGFSIGENFAKRLTEQKDDIEVEFVLNQDTPMSEVAVMLEEMGIVENAWLYRLEIMLKGSSTYYRAGTYILNANMDHTQINVTLRRQPVAAVVEDRIVIPEGFTVRDIALYLENQGYFSQEEFLLAAETMDFPFTFIRQIPVRDNRFEGYLFPDTYFVSSDPTPYEIIYKMLARFDDIYTDDFRNRAAELGLTMDEVITKASIIEREVRVPSERAMVGQVIYNRLERNMRLEICATVLYVLDKRRDRLLLEDLEFDSPYNTYINWGLPPGPISNPGLECIRAALYPSGGNMVYYVLQDDSTGEHFFTDNYDMFLRAKEQYNQPF